MKKINAVLMLVLSLVVICGALGTPVLADDSITVILDGNQLEFDVQPCVIEDRTMVPMRAIFEALGAVVSWDDDTQTVTALKDDMIIQLSVGSYQMMVNDSVVPLDVAAVIIDDRTLIPLRAVSEALNADVSWDEATSTVFIITNEDAGSTETVEGWHEVYTFSSSDEHGKSDVFELKGGEVRIRYEVTSSTETGVSLSYLLEDGATLAEDAQGNFRIADDDIMTMGTESGEASLGVKPAGKYYLQVNTSSVSGYKLIVEEMN